MIGIENHRPENSEDGGSVLFLFSAGWIGSVECWIVGIEIFGVQLFLNLFECFPKALKVYNFAFPQKF